MMLEDMVSGLALARRAAKLGRRLTAAEVFAASATDPELDDMVTAFVRELAFHLVNLTIVVDPARIAVGGGMVRSWHRIEPVLAEALAQAVPYPPELVLAHFPHDAPLLGAIALAVDAAGPLAEGTGPIDVDESAARNGPNCPRHTSARRAHQQLAVLANRHEDVHFVPGCPDASRADGHPFRPLRSATEPPRRFTLERARHMRRHKSIAAAAVVAAGLLAAACSSTPAPSGNSGSGGGNAAPSGVLTIDNESGGTWTCDFNPFNLSYISFALGPVYEPLAFVNTLQSGKATPWLATKWVWGTGNTTLTFTIRSGVKFTNGDPLTPADVAYTFNLLKKYPTLDINAIWSDLTSVTASGQTVVMSFKQPAVTNFYYIADQIGIVDQKVWSKVSNPVNYPDKNPVGTGAFTTGSSDCTPQNIKYVANTHYWQPGEPKVGTVNYPSFLTNDTANTFLASGQAQWGSQFIPSIKTFYTDKSPNYHYWFPPVANVSLFINLTNPMLKDVAVRQAMAYAINRQKASTIGEYGYEPASNQSGIVTPTFSSWLDTSQAATYGNNYAYNPAKAISTLEKAGLQARLERHLHFAVRQAAVLQPGEQRRVLGLGRRGPDDHSGPEGGRHPGHGREPGPDHLRERHLHREV